MDELGLPAVIKAQVLAGGRGKAGGVVVVRTREEATREAQAHPRPQGGRRADRALLVEEEPEHSGEMYLSISLDRGKREFVALASRSGGTEVESQGKGDDGRAAVPLEGLTGAGASALSAKLGLSGRTSTRIPLDTPRLGEALARGGVRARGDQPARGPQRRDLLALDSKVVLDDNALFRHPEFSQLPPEDPLEGEAAKFGFAFVRLDGDVAVVGNGAGLVLSTLDMVADAGGGPRASSTWEGRPAGEGRGRAEACARAPEREGDPRQHIRRDNAHDRRRRGAEGRPLRGADGARLRQDKRRRRGARRTPFSRGPESPSSAPPQEAVAAAVGGASR